MRYEKDREIRQFYTEVQKAYPALKGWKLRITKRVGFYGGFCNRKNRSLDCNFFGLSFDQAKRLLLHEVTHVLVDGKHAEPFWNKYEELVRKWLGRNLDFREIRDREMCLVYEKRISYTQGA